MVHNNLGPSILLVLLVTLTIGCESRDERLAEFAERSSARQARQSEAMAEQSEELAAAAHQLVEQDAAARRELIQAHDQAQQQLAKRQADLDQQRLKLHAERQAAAQDAVRAPVIAEALIVVGLIVATLLPLLVTAYALYRLPETGPSDALLSSALLEDLAAPPVGAPHPQRPPAMPPGTPAPRLPGQEQPDEPGENSSDIPVS